MSRTGALILGDDLTLPDLWIGLHANAEMWIRAGSSPDGQRQRSRIDETDRRLLEQLRQVEAPRWSVFAEAAGWTAYSAIAIAWCSGADPETVATRWYAASLPLTAHGHGARAARLLPPEAKPQDPRLSVIGRMPSLPRICLGILSADNLVRDVTDAEMATAAPGVRDALTAAGIAGPSQPADGPQRHSA